MPNSPASIKTYLVHPIGPDDAIRLQVKLALIGIHAQLLAVVVEVDPDPCGINIPVGGRLEHKLAHLDVLEAEFIASRVTGAVSVDDLAIGVVEVDFPSGSGGGGNSRNEDGGELHVEY